MTKTRRSSRRPRATSDPQERARRILARCDFFGPDATRLQEYVEQIPGLYARTCLGLAFLIETASPLPPALERKLTDWIAAIQRTRRELYEQLIVFGDPHVPANFVERWQRQAEVLRGEASAS